MTRGTLSVAGLLLLLAAVPAEATFGYRRLITVNAGQVAGATQTNFPMLVNITGDASLRTVGNGGRVVNGLGYDIQFRALDGVTVLDHEVERYDGFAGTLVTWVRIPTLADGTQFYLYYGDPQVSCPLANAGGVWDANYRAVYHLGSTALWIATTGELRDSTINHHDAADGGTSDAAGQIGRGRNVSLAPRDVIHTNHTEYLSQFTFSTWLRWNGTPGVSDGGAGTDFPRILSKPPTEKLLFIHNNSGSDTVGRVRYQSGNGSWRTTTLVPTVPTWVHITVVDDETTPAPTIYINGAASGFSTNNPRSADTASPDPFFYGNRQAMDRSVDGILDEIRVSSILRPASWILTEYRNQSAPGTFYSLAPESPAPAAQAGGCGAAGQMGKDGNLTVAAAGTILNRYATLSANAARGATSIGLTNPGGASGLDPATLTAGDLLLVIQMQGATIDTANTASYGDIVNLDGAGLYELVTVTSVAGSTVNLACGLANGYTAAGRVQVIRVPQYSSLTLSGSVTAPAWNATGQFYGGVAAIRAETLDMSGSINATGLGFVGGQAIDAGAAVGFGSTVYVTANAQDGAEKGESIAGNQAAYDGMGGRNGRGAPANGGGGGNGHNSGGGGGANGHNGPIWNGQGNPDNSLAGWTTAWNLDPTLSATTTSSGGGRGGYTFSGPNLDATTTAPGNAAWAGDNRREVGGLGGRALSNHTGSRVFMGGGGGAGHANDAAVGDGGNGGGIVFVLSRSIRGSGVAQIVANGANGESAVAGDGAGGGGGGGSIVVNALSTVLGVALRANGGAGGNEPGNGNEAHGPGGGGGGGFVAVFAPLQDPLTRTATAGANGTTASAGLTEFLPNGATRGAPGLAVQPAVAVPGGCINTAVVGGGCPAGTYISGPNLVGNADFATGAGPGPGFNLAAQFTASVPNAGDGNCPADTQVAVRSGSITCGVTQTQVPFPGDPAFAIPGAAGWLHVNGNNTGSPYTPWQQAVAGLTPGATYSFAAYASNVVAPGIPCLCVDEPRIRFSRDGTPVSELLPVPYELTGQGDTWRRFQTTFAAAAASHLLSISDAATGPTGDDLSLTRIEVRLCALVTAVELMGFDARPGDARVELAWQTGSETDNMGFHLYRAPSPDGPWTRITSALIPGLGSSPEGASYSWVDAGLQNGVTYFYQLEDVETTGRTQRHGPVWATPAASGDPRSSGDGAPPEPVAQPVAHGDPFAVSFRILERSRRHLLAELRTGGFFATPLADGSVRLRVPSFQEVSGPGQPAVPVLRTWVEAMAGRKARITSLRAADVWTFDLRPEAAAEKELAASADGTLSLVSRRARPRSSPGAFPESLGRLLDAAFQGETKKRQLELAPLRYEAATGRLSLARVVTVRIVFDGRVSGERSLGGSQGRRERPVPRTGEVLARLHVKDPGLYTVSFNEVFGRAQRSLNPARIGLTRLGEPVPFHVESRTGRFGPGARLYFVSQGASLASHAQEAVYELVKTAAPPPRMRSASASPQGGAVAWYLEDERLEVQRLYQAALVEAPDLWLWDYVISPASKAFPFTLSLPAGTGTARLTVDLQGGSDLPANPEHHVRIRLNGTTVAEATWDGKATRRLTAEVAAGLLHDGGNTLDVENVGVPGAGSSLFYLDAFRVEHPRPMVADSGRLEGTALASGTALVAGLPARSLVVDVTDAAPGWLRGGVLTPDGFAFRVQAGRRYLAVAPDAVLRPRLVAVTPSSLRSTLNQADYLVVAPREFLDASTPLLDQRRAQGLTAMAVAVEDVYSEFGSGETSPRALQDFLSYAYHRWSAPTLRYVLLLGDASYDPKDFLKTGFRDRLPGVLVKTPFLWTISDPSYAAVNGEDVLPDVALGRLPAASLAEAQALVAKVVAFEQQGFSLDEPRVLVADNSDAGGDFEGGAEEIAQDLFGGEAGRIYLSQLGGGTRAAIRDAFDGGASLVSYMGHGSTLVWASENVFNNGDVANLLAQPRQPLLFTLNCLNGYFHMPGTSSLAEAFVKAQGRGAIAAVAPSGMSVNDAAHIYHKAILEELLQGGHERLGDALLAAQGAYAEAGALPELLALYQLLGDPALKLR